MWGCQDELMLALEVDSTPFRWQDTVDEDDPACRPLVTVGTRSWGCSDDENLIQIRSRKRLYYPFRPLAFDNFFGRISAMSCLLSQIDKNHSLDFFQLCHGLTSQVHTAIKPLPGKGSSACRTLVCLSRCHGWARKQS